MKEYLILISVGPVQDFISSARKLRDLWFGSYMLSEISKAVAKSIHENGCELIFPYIVDSSELDKDSELIVANKIMGYFKGDAPPSYIIAEARKSFGEFYRTLAEGALKNLKKVGGVKIDEKLYWSQLEDPGEFYGVWNEITGSYHEAKDGVEKLLAGRKNLRNFDAPCWDGAGLRKSSLDGFRETIFIGKPVTKTGLIKEHEYLDTLGCIKRFYPLKGSSPHFDDLSDIALIPYLNKIYSDRKLTELLLSYENALLECSEGRRSKSAMKNSDLKIISDMLYTSKEKLEDLLDRDSAKALSAFSRLTSTKNGAGEPPKYACIMLGDGDKMGQALDSIKDMNGHRIFSSYLAQFASEAGTIIHEYAGSMIYAGGDDVMAYLPLDSMLECSDEVRTLFANKMKAVFKKLNIQGAELPTFSIGLAVVHHSYPLDKALDLARDAEKVAKNKGGRNALAIIQSKRGGSDITVYGKWDKEGNALGLLPRLGAMVKLHAENILPSTLGYQLRDIKNQSGDEMKFSIGVYNGKEKLIPENASAASVICIVGHKENADKLKTFLEGRSKISRLSNEMVVARQISEIKKITESATLADDHRGVK